MHIFNPNRRDQQKYSPRVFIYLKLILGQALERLLANSNESIPCWYLHKTLQQIVYPRVSACHGKHQFQSSWYEKEEPAGQINTRGEFEWRWEGVSY